MSWCKWWTFSIILEVQPKTILQEIKGSIEESAENMLWNSKGFCQSSVDHYLELNSTRNSSKNSSRNITSYTCQEFFLGFFFIPLYIFLYYSSYRLNFSYSYIPVISQDIFCLSIFHPIYKVFLSRHLQELIHKILSKTVSVFYKNTMN